MGDTRERILQAGLRLCVEKGYAKTSIADIERAAGLAPRTGGFYRHFRSKEDLAAEIGETCIIETRQDLGFDGVLPLGDTRAELALIAKGYLLASERQAPLAALIAEVRHLPKIQELERRVNEDLLAALTGWLSEKAFARGKNKTDLVALLFTIFGGWLFYLSKRGTPDPPGGLTDKVMLDQWADFWARVLDQLSSDVYY
jgi:AcrR family transcriptional regulator